MEDLWSPLVCGRNRRVCISSSLLPRLHIPYFRDAPSIFEGFSSPVRLFVDEIQTSSVCQVCGREGVGEWGGGERELEREVERVHSHMHVCDRVCVFVVFRSLLEK